MHVFERGSTALIERSIHILEYTLKSTCEKEKYSQWDKSLAKLCRALKIHIKQTELWFTGMFKKAKYPAYI